MDNTPPFEIPLDDQTKQHIASALWMRVFEPENIPDDVAAQLRDSKNSTQSFGDRMGAFLDWLLAHPQSHNQSYERRYSTLKHACNELTPHQAYVIVNKFLGLNASQGFKRLPETSLDEIASEGYDPTYGAQPLKRVIQQRIQSPLAVELLKREFEEGSRVKIDYLGSDFTFERNN